MIRQAVRKYPVDLRNSYMVGDKMDDLTLVKNARIARGILVLTGNGRKSEKKLNSLKPGKTVVVSDILAAAKWILANKGQK